MSITPEGRTKKDIRKWLEAHGCWYFMPVKMRFGRIGIPDFIVCMNGRFVAIEAKRKGNLAGTTVLQDDELKAIESAKGIALVIDDVQQLEDYFRAHKT